MAVVVWAELISVTVEKVMIVAVAAPAAAEVGNETRVWLRRCAVTVVTVAIGVATVANAVP